MILLEIPKYGIFFLFLGFSAAGSRKSQVSRLLNLGKESTKRKKQSHLCNCFFSVGAEETSIVRNILQPNIFYKSCFPSPTIAPNFFIGTSYSPCAGANIIPGLLREYKVKPSVSGKISTPHSSGSISPENLASPDPCIVTAPGNRDIPKRPEDAYKNVGGGNLGKTKQTPKAPESA